MVFDLEGTLYSAATAADGIAEVTTKVTGHRRTQHVVASFAGTQTYLGSSTEADIVWGQPF